MILVFGGTGFVGSFVSSRLSSVDEVVLAVRKPGKSKFRQVRFSNPEEIPGLISRLNPDVVINFIGVLKGDYATAHVEIPKLISIGAEEIKARLIHTSAFGADENSGIPYFRTKALGEKAVRKVKSHAIVRPSLVLGPGQRIFRQALRFRVFPKVTARVQPIDLRDLAELYFRLIDSKNGTFNACGNEVVPLGELVGNVLKRARKRVLLLPFPRTIAKALGKVDKSFLMALEDNVCTQNHALEILGSLRPLEESLFWTAEGLR
ncbi:sugar nucleotide-binding protein [Thermococcus sp.]|uniref:sugar nucleotide-binding protein n=1 Tax=Thermococcus sp. TaxID=35749 RepID=UPI0025F55A2A|nr:sugar nucleotide-binding protein [Thermococcus sp.]